MAKKNIVINEGVGYFLPQTRIERELDANLLTELSKDSLPKIHDIHLTFKWENVETMLSHQSKRPDIFNRIEYRDPNRGPDAKELHKVNIPGYKDTPYLSLNRLSDSANDRLELPIIERLFSTVDPMSLYQLWKENKCELEKLDGGFQERLDLRTYKLIFQFYSTGTCKVIISNSEHPFDAIQFKESLNTIDGIFYARSGVRFLDIAPLFYLEKFHMNNDIDGKQSFSPGSKFNYTVSDMEGYLIRKYEKVINGQPLLRTEACYEKGNFTDSNITTFLDSYQALHSGGPTMQKLVANFYRQQKAQEELTDSVRSLIINQRIMVKKVDAWIDNQAKKLQQNQAPTSASPLVPTNKQATDIAGFVSAADILSAPHLSPSEIALVMEQSNKEIQRKL
jgi:hypothetical protein